MTILEYAIIIHGAAEGGYWSEVPALPGAGSQGESIDETVAMTKEAIEAALQDMIDDGEAVAAPNDGVLKVQVAV